MRSTTDALVRLESSITSAFLQKQHIVCIFFDIEKAYDTTWRFGILQRIHDFGMRGRLPNFLREFLRNRSFSVRCGSSYSSSRVYEEGVPQGSILSVTLFAVAIDNIISSLPIGVSSSLYVDDLAIWFSGSNMSVVERRLQLAVNQVAHWATSHGFRFSTTKTVAMHFCRLRGLHPDPDIILYGSRIRCEDETRFLGLTFDRRLTWGSHLRALKTSCMQALDLIRVLSHTSWGADRRTLLQLYHALVGSKLAYGCEVYSSATHSKLKILDAVHHAGIRLAIGAFRSSPIPSLLVEAGVPPLELLRKQSMARYWFRVLRLPDSLVSACVLQQSRSLSYSQHPRLPHPYGYRARLVLDELTVSTFKICPAKMPRISPWSLPEVHICKFNSWSKNSLPSQYLTRLFLEHSAVHSDSVHVYTDGSKSDSGVGLGVVFPSFCQGGSLPLAASIFTAELSALLLAVKLIFIQEHESFTVFCDSQSALMALETFNSRHPLVTAILEWLFLIHRRGKVVRFCWVPAHVGIQGNEKVDALAKAAALRRPPEEHPLPASDLVPVLKKAVVSLWQRQWDSIGANKLRGIIPRVTWPRVSPSMPRKWETALVRLRIGHTRLTHSFLMERAPPPFCDDCLVPLTVRHLLVECPSLGDLRRRFLSGHRAGDGTYCLSSMLGEGAQDLGGGALSFISAAGFLKKL